MVIMLIHPIIQVRKTVIFQAKTFVNEIQIPTNLWVLFLEL